VVALRYRAGEPAPGTSPERFRRMLDAAQYLADHIHEAAYLNFKKEAKAALGLPPDVYSYALLPIGYPMGRFRSGSPCTSH
jgi:hypothetical protein